VKKPRADLQDQVAAAEQALLAALGDASERQRQDIRRVSELKIITDEYRQLVLSSGDCSAADLAKLEALYSEARAALGIVEKKHHGYVSNSGFTNP
jgi:hypothetical protein